jgi:hypothetical protein
MDFLTASIALLHNPSSIWSMVETMLCHWYGVNGMPPSNPVRKVSLTSSLQSYTVQPCHCSPQHVYALGEGGHANHECAVSDNINPRAWARIRSLHVQHPRTNLSRHHRPGSYQQRSTMVHHQKLQRHQTSAKCWVLPTGQGRILCNSVHGVSVLLANKNACAN